MAFAISSEVANLFSWVSTLSFTFLSLGSNLVLLLNGVSTNPKTIELDSKQSI